LQYDPIRRLKIKRKTVLFAQHSNKYKPYKLGEPGKGVDPSVSEVVDNPESVFATSCTVVVGTSEFDVAKQILYTVMIIAGIKTHL
jgi:ABC-type polar amino acid transport system ATPase subunit